MTAPKKKIVLRSHAAASGANKPAEKATPTPKAEKPIENRGLTPAGRVPDAPLGNPQWEVFCHLYASDRDFFGNGVECYAQAYGIDITEKGAYFSAKQCAYKLLTKVDINERINEILDITVSDAVIDKELNWTALQRGDLGAKVAAIKERNKLKGRTITRLQLSGAIETEASPEQLARIADVVRERAGK